MREERYLVGGHCFEVIMGKGDTLWGMMRQYAPFVTSSRDVLFRLHIGCEGCEDLFVQSGELLGEFDSDVLALRVERLDTGGSRMTFRAFGSALDIVLVAEVDGRAWLLMDEGLGSVERLFGLNNALMLLYTLYTAPYGMLLVHASVNLAPDGRAYVFHARSGTGKSTHNRLWLESVEGSELLNDDNPVIRVIDGEVWVYGSPWSGKTPCYRNISAPLGAFVRIVQAPANRIERLGVLKSYASVLPSCSCIKWEKRLENSTRETIERVATLVPCYSLECLPDAAAAQLCYQIVSKR